MSDWGKNCACKTRMPQNCIPTTYKASYLSKDWSEKQMPSVFKLMLLFLGKGVARVLASRQPSVMSCPVDLKCCCTTHPTVLPHFKPYKLALCMPTKIIGSCKLYIQRRQFNFSMSKIDDFTHLPAPGAGNQQSMESRGAH